MRLEKFRRSLLHLHNPSPAMTMRMQREILRMTKERKQDPLTPSTHRAKKHNPARTNLERPSLI
jgi:hypothetical protein